MTVGQRIKKQCKELGLSVDEVAEKSGKNRATIYTSKDKLYAHIQNLQILIFNIII